MSKNGGALPAPVAYLFERQAKIVVSPGSMSVEKAMDAALEVDGIVDLSEFKPESDPEEASSPVLDVRCDVKDVQPVREALEKLGLQVQSIELIYESMDKLADLSDSDGQQIQQILEWLDDHMDVSKVYHNLG